MDYIADEINRLSDDKHIIVYLICCFYYFLFI